MQISILSRNFKCNSNLQKLRYQHSFGEELIYFVCNPESVGNNFCAKKLGELPGTHVAAITPCPPASHPLPPFARVGDAHHLAVFDDRAAGDADAFGLQGFHEFLVVERL